MSEVQEKPTLVFDDKNYVIDDLSDQAKYFIGQLQDLNQQANAAKARLDQLEVARSGFTELLRKELEKPEESE
jgi:hypothetical protein